MQLHASPHVYVMLCMKYGLFKHCLAATWEPVLRGAAPHIQYVRPSGDHREWAPESLQMEINLANDMLWINRGHEARLLQSCKEDSISEMPWRLRSAPVGDVTLFHF
jgi:hypothetical protein